MEGYKLMLSLDWNLVLWMLCIIGVGLIFISHEISKGKRSFDLSVLELIMASVLFGFSFYYLSSSLQLLFVSSYVERVGSFPLQMLVYVLAGVVSYLALEWVIVLLRSITSKIKRKPIGSSSIDSTGFFFIVDESRDTKKDESIENTEDGDNTDWLDVEDDDEFGSEEDDLVYQDYFNLINQSSSVYEDCISLKDGFEVTREEALLGLSIDYTLRNDEEIFHVMFKSEDCDSFTLELKFSKGKMVKLDTDISKAYLSFVKEVFMIEKDTDLHISLLRLALYNEEYGYICVFG